MKKITLTIFSVLFVIISLAQTPESFKYQTVVRDASGYVMANQNVSFQISILQGSSSGTTIYTETHSKTSNEFGLLNLNIGEGTTSNNFSSINWANGPFFLKVELDETGGSTYTVMGTSQLLSVPYAMYAKDVENKDDADSDPNNELLNSATLSGTNLEITDAGGTKIIDLSSLDQSSMSVNDADADPTNELQIINFSNDTLYLNNGGQVFLGNYTNLWQQNDTNIYYNSGWVGVGTSTPSGKMVVQGDDGVNPDSALFEVKNKNGQTIFAVYDGGVRVYVDDNVAKASSDKGGFAVAGYRNDKTQTSEFLRVTPDSVRVYIKDDDQAKASTDKGGFAVAGYRNDKTLSNDYLFVQDDSTRVYTGDSLGGFGVSNIGTSEITSYMQLTPENYFIGHESGSMVNGGLYNSFIGYQSGLNTVGGSNNVFIGYHSGYTNGGGGNGVYIGTEAGYSNNATWQNTYIGYKAGYSISGASNTILGSYSGESAGGGNNTFIGTSAGRFATNGNNTFIGNNAGSGSSSAHLTGRFNTTLGESAGGYLTSGEGNTMIGRNSGYLTYEGSYNTFLGLDAGRQCRGGNGNVYIGYQVASDQTDWQGKSNRLAIDNSNVDSLNVLIYGKFDDDIISFNASVGIGTLTPAYDLQIVNTQPTISLNNLEIADMGSSNMGIDGDIVPYGGSTMAYDLGNNTTTEHWDDVCANTFTTFSDARLKTNVHEISYGLNAIMKLRPVSYIYLNKIDISGKTRLGLIAQEVEEVIPNVVVNDDIDANPETGEKIVKRNEYKALNYIDLIPVLIKATQEQQKIIEEKEKQIEELQKQNIEILKRLDKLENR